MDGLKARLSFDAVAYDYDNEYLTIDTDTHIININNVSRLFGVQYDGNSKLIKFRVRNQLSDIQKMQDSIVYINWIDSKGVKGQSIAINKSISNDICEFAWKVPFDTLKNSGVLHFAMSAVVTKDSSSVIDQRWSTQIASVITPDGIYIKSYTPSSEEEDRIAQIYNELTKMINKQNDNLSDMKAKVSSLKEDLVNLNDFISKDENQSVRLTTLEDTIQKLGNASINNNNEINISELEGYKSAYYLSKKKHYIYIDGSIQLSDYFSVCIGRNFKRMSIHSDNSIGLLCESVVRYRDSTIPTKDNPIEVSENDVICITYNHKEYKITGIKTNKTISDDFADKVSKISVNSISDITDGIKLTEESTFEETYKGYGTANGITENDSYVSYGFTVSDDTRAFVKSLDSNAYFSICVYDDKEFFGGVRYRDDTLPLEGNPITLKQGQYVVLTTNVQYKLFTVELSDISISRVFKNGIKLSNEQIKQVETVLDNLFIKYSAKHKDRQTEQLNIYIPTGVGYVRYEFVHNVDSKINSNVWRMDNVYACDNEFNTRYQITVSGEWEIAIRLSGRSDFSGGISHGDQVMNDIVFFVDGGVSDITKFTELTKITELIIVESSNLYDPNDSATIIAEHGSEHIFNKNGLKINQSLLWKGSFPLSGCYMAMNLPSKSVTDKIYFNNDIVPKDIVLKMYPEGITKLTMYGTDSGVKNEFSVEKYKGNGKGLTGRMDIADNGGNAYNKCYFIIADTGNTSEGETWETTTVYKFDVNK